jgi:hypothetical protein
MELISGWLTLLNLPIPDCGDIPYLVGSRGNIYVLVPIALAPELMVYFANLSKVARATIRYPLETTVVFWWEDENGIFQQREGLGRDVSDRGVFVFASACPPVGTNVGLRISLEGFPDGPSALRYEVVGRVLRVEQSRSGEKSSGLAVLLLNASVAGSELRKYPFTDADQNGEGN